MKIIILTILFISVFLFNTNAQGGIKDRIFVIEDSLIDSFDEQEMELVLKKSSLLRLGETDFTKYSFVLFESYTCLVRIIGDEMSIRPFSLFIYIHNKSILESNGRIRIISYHLDRDDPTLKSFRRIYSAIAKSNHDRQ